MPNKNITMKEIAQEAGVSIGTVSLALRNHPSLLAATRERVQTVARELGYAPNPLVSALMSQVSRGRVVNQGTVIAVLLDHTYGNLDQLGGQTYSGRLVSGIVDRLQELGCEYEMFRFTHEDRQNERLDGILYARGIHGVLLPFVWDVGTMPKINWERLLVVTAGYSLMHPPLHRVVPDQFGAVRMAMEAITKAGYRRPGFYTLERIDRRVQGLEEAAFTAHLMRASEGRVRKPLVLRDTSWEFESFRRWFRKHQPDAVVSNFPHLDEWLSRMDVSVPDEVGFVRLGVSGDSTVTHTDLQSQRVGSHMVDLLTASLNRNERGVPAWPKRNVVGAKLIEGRTLRRTEEPVTAAEADSKTPRKNASLKRGRK